jgi:sugar O-acyltransferase (sialic acid O-acetyltransferase NeuD family)
VKPLVIVGAGGFGREVYWLAEEINAHRPTWKLLGFLDDDPQALHGVDFPASVVGPVDSYSGLQGAFAVCAIGSPKARKTVTQRLDELGARWATLIHPTSFVGTGSTIGPGSVLCRAAGVTVNVTLGKHVHVNVKGGAGHDAQIGDFSTLSAFVDVTGGAVVEQGVFLGSHAVVLPQARVGAWSRVGAGSVVLRNVEAESTVIGVPAREVRFS